MSRSIWIIASCIILFSFASFAATRHVPLVYATIQAAIDSSSNGDTVLVNHGTYPENIDFKGKRIVVGSLLLTTGDTSHTSLTIIDGGGSVVNKSVVIFQSGEDSMSVLRGFTVRNGYATGTHGGGITVANGSRPRIEDCHIINNTGDPGPVNGIGIYCTHSSPTVRRCLIASNSAPTNGNYDHLGGGVCVASSSAPVFDICTIVNNSIAASANYRNYGGGVYVSGSVPLMRNCTIADNAADFGGGIAVAAANVQVRNCTIESNYARGNGGAAASYQSSAFQVDSCLLIKNRAEWNGGALYTEQLGGLYATRSTITDNSASTGAGAFASTGTVLTLTNCIVWYNWANEIFPSNLTQVTYCNVRGGYQGTGNIDIDPLFCDWDSEVYTLASNSPCLTGGSGGTQIGRLPAGCGSITPRTRKVLADYPSLQAAILHSYQGDTVLVAAGTYVENIQLWGRRVLVTSNYTLSGDTSHIGKTILSGGGSVVNKSVVSFVGAEDSLCKLRGFTITDGYASDSHGGGVSIARNSRPRIEDCRIIGNTAPSLHAYGIGIFCTGSSPTITRCVIAYNTAPTNGNYDHLGGGVYVASGSSPVFNDCLIMNNVTAASVNYRNLGGGVYCSGSSPVFSNCTIANNRADFGGGIFACNTSSVLARNSAFDGDSVRGHGGGVASYTSSVVQLDSCSMTKNHAEWNGGALYMEQNGKANATRSTITNNSASLGAGLYAATGSSPALTNCIVWYNWFNEISPSNLTQITYCDVRGGYQGTGNVDADPLFCDWMTERLTLAGNSVCLTAGSGGSRMGYYPAGCNPIHPKLRRVPVEYATMQDAILHAYQGDTILVATGTRAENIDFWGRRVLLTSQYTLSGDTSAIGQTVLDGGGSGVNKSVVSFVEAEDTLSVLRGFTITNGYASGNHAGGITIANGASPRVEDCRVIGNVGSSGPVNGIGISCTGSSPTFSRCVIKNNSAPANGNYDHNGGGVYLAAGSAPSFTRCSIGGNSIAASVNYRNFGGGIYCNASNPTLHNCFIGGNSADYGGGIYLRGNSSAQIFNCLVVLNQVRSLGGGLYSENSQPTSVNSTFSRNLAAGSGGAMHCLNSTTTVVNTICWRDTTPGVQEITISGGSDTIRYSDVQGGWQGTGNMNMDPIFEDEIGFRLSLSSPCIDAGDPAPAFNDPEDPARPDSALYPARGGVRSDVGAYGGSGSTPPIPTSVHNRRSNVAERPEEFRLLQNYPNPFNPNTTIGYGVQGAGYGVVTLKIYDILGREVATLVNETKVPGWYSMTWDAKGLASGMYLYRMTAGSFTDVKKMLLIR